MQRLIYTVKLRDRIINADLLNRFYIACVGEIVQKEQVRFVLGMWNGNQNRTRQIGRLTDWMLNGASTHQGH